jgi:hypothetical protein
MCPVCCVPSCCPSEILMRDEVRLFLATKPDCMNRQLHILPTHGHKQSNQPYSKEDRHKQQLNKTDITRETEDWRLGF